MLGRLLHEIMRRHLWPIAVIALLVAVAAPLLFLRSAAPDAPVAAPSAPSTAPAERLPARAQRLLATGDAAHGASRRPGRAASDPFKPPSARGASSAGGSSAGDDRRAAKTSAPEEDAAPAATEPVPVVITNADGTKPANPTTPIGGEGATTPTGARAVDVRFGERSPARLHRDIPRLQTFVSGDRVVAIFVKYSPKRDKAVFAIGPKTLVTGDVECRRKGGVCRYVDLPAGKDVRLTTLANDGTLVSHRLEVVRIVRTSQSGATSAPANGSCLLGKLLTLTTNDPPLASDAC